MFLRSLISATALLLAPLAAFAQTAEEAPDCLTAEECAAIVRDYRIGPPPPPNAHLSSGVDPSPIAKAIARLQALGDAGVIALMPLLEHPNFNVRNRAGYALTEFSTVDPRHLRALLSAHRNGVPWLERTIARTGTDEALTVLWSDFVRNPDWGSNAQVFHALPLFGERVFPLIEAELRKCRSSSEAQLCSGVNGLLDEYEPFPAFALPLLEAIAVSPDASGEARGAAVDQLIRRRHPHGLTVLVQALEAYVGRAGDPAGNATAAAGGPESSGQFEDIDLVHTIRRIAHYGREASRAGPVVARVLGRRDVRDARAEAALALGRIGYAEGADAILAQRSDFGDDWYLAYNAAEGLGRLRAQAARPLIETLAREHWYKPVRNNAERALNFLGGGEFARPGVDGDGGGPPEENEWPLTGAEFRYAGDFRDLGSCVTAFTERSYGQYFPDDLRWPGAARNEDDDSDEIELAPRDLSRAEQRAFRAAHRAFEDRRPVAFAVEMGASVVAGTNMGEWGGAIYRIDRRGRVEPLVEGNAMAAFKSGDTLFVVTGLSHLVMSQGDLWVIRLKRGAPVVERRIRLPMRPHNFEIAYRQTLVLGGPRGDVAIRADGALVDPQKIESCAD
jgi:hypothetical protein